MPPCASQSALLISGHSGGHCMGTELDEETEEDGSDEESMTDETEDGAEDAITDEREASDAPCDDTADVGVQSDSQTGMAGGAQQPYQSMLLRHSFAPSSVMQSHVTSALPLKHVSQLAAHQAAMAAVWASNAAQEPPGTASGGRVGIGSAPGLPPSLHVQSNRSMHSSGASEEAPAEDAAEAEILAVADTVEEAREGGAAELAALDPGVMMQQLKLYAISTH